MNLSFLSTAIRLFIIMTLTTGVIYPLLITMVGHFAFPYQAHGSIIKSHTIVIGSTLIAQPPTNSGYFQPRPSAGNYSTEPSAASNLALSNVMLHDSMTQRAALWGKTVGEMPPDLLFSSGSGLDPHISPESAQLQLNWIVRLRGLSDNQITELRSLIVKRTEKPQFGILGNERVNVLHLNLDLENILHHNKQYESTK